ncbi:MAG TPA: hypothetical protein VKY85_08145 [Candidatus Angelobacter sp.]|nr:hypothetical protein [Candidatus Angelobacter sp.]
MRRNLQINYAKLRGNIAQRQYCGVLMIDRAASLGWGSGNCGHGVVATRVLCHRRNHWRRTEKLRSAERLKQDRSHEQQ